MAVYTDVTDDDLSDFLALYALGELLSYRGIAEGVENSNFLIHTTKGPFILTLFEKRVAKAELPFFIGLMDHLAARGLSCPQPVKRKDGTVVGELSGRPAVIVTFLEGMWHRKPKALHCHATGGALASLHVKAADFALSRPNSLSVRGWRPLAQKAGEAVNTIAPDLHAQIMAEISHHEANWPDNLPKGIIHADLFPDNVFFIGENLSGLIDFYFACHDTLAYDVAIGLNAWCFDANHHFDFVKGAAFLKGYEEVRPLSAAERSALPQLCRGAALRFLLTRLVDWLNVPPDALVKPKDPLEYLAKLRFHQKVARPGEYGLSL